MVCICRWVHARSVYTTLSLHVSILGFAPEFSARKWQMTPLSGLPGTCSSCLSSTEAQAALWPALHQAQQVQLIRSPTAVTVAI